LKKVYDKVFYFVISRHTEKKKNIYIYIYIYILLAIKVKINRGSTHG